MTARKSTVVDMGWVDQFLWAIETAIDIADQQERHWTAQCVSYPSSALFFEKAVRAAERAKALRRVIWILEALPNITESDLYFD